MQILHSDFSPSKERMKAGILELVLILRERARVSYKARNKVLQEFHQWRNKLQGVSKNKKSYTKKLNCSMYSRIAREFNKVLEE